MTPADDNRPAREIFSEQELDPTAPPPSADEEWELRDADGAPADNMEGEAPSG